MEYTVQHTLGASTNSSNFTHDDVTKWKHFPRYWPFVWGIHRSSVNSPHKGQWRGVLMFSLFCAWMNEWVNNRGAGDLRRHRAHYDVTVMILLDTWDPFYWHRLTFISTWISNPMPNNVWDEISFQTSTATPLKFWNGWVISYHIW